MSPGRGMEYGRVAPARPSRRPVRATADNGMDGRGSTADEQDKEFEPQGRRERMRTWAAAAMASIVTLGLATQAAGKPDSVDPLPPPDVPPQSRLTVTPSEIRDWLSRTPSGAEEPQPTATPAPRIAAPPPAAPTLTPPPAATLPPPPTVAPSTIPGAPELAAPREDSAGAATLPPDSPDITPPPEPVVGRVPKPDDVLIVYAPDATEVPSTARKDLDRLADWLAANPLARIRVEAFAGGDPGALSQARRTALLRAREVRRHLVDLGAPENGIEVRVVAAGNDGAPANRVEIMVPSP